MRALLALVFLASTANATQWQQTSAVRLTAGTWQLVDSPIPLWTKMRSQFSLLRFPPSCGVFQVPRLKFLEDGQGFGANLYTNTPTPAGQEWVYKFDEAHTMDEWGINITIPAGGDCIIELWQAPFSEPDPGTQPPGKPLERHCRKVAFNMSYDYEQQIDQVSVLSNEPEPCIVFVRFKTLQGYRFFLDDRRSKGLSPDFDILQPENVKVEMEHRVGG